MSLLRLGAISFDCADPRPLTTFWADLLGGEVVRLDDEIGIVRLEHVLLTAMRVDHHVPTTWPESTVPKQGHVDLEVDDLDEAERRAVGLGAVRAERQPDPGSHLVMIDPAGHPFCLSLSTNFPTSARVLT